MQSLLARGDTRSSSRPPRADEKPVYGAAHAVLIAWIAQAVVVLAFWAIVGAMP